MIPRLLKLTLCGLAVIAVSFVTPATPQTRGVSVLTSPTTGVGIGTIWGIFVGLSKYQQPDLNLSYADKDAQSLHSFFTENFRGRIPADHFRLLLNEQATRGGILQTLGEVLRLAQPEDLVILTMALHGLPET